MNRSQIINEVKSIIENNPYFRCDICFLRGSFALEKENINSDVDLLVISDDFKGIMYKKRREFIQSIMKGKIERKVDAICLDTNEYVKLIEKKRQMLKNERMERLI